MKKDPLAEHRKKMAELHTQFSKKAQYHQQKGYLELKDIYWLMHEFFSVLLSKEHHFTEEELMHELKEFKHDFLQLPPELVLRWLEFFKKLSESQYGGKDRSQDELKLLLTEFSALVDRTLEKAPETQDAFSEKLQAAQLLAENGDHEKAEIYYRELTLEYKNLTPERQAATYPLFQQLYSSYSCRA